MENIFSISLREHRDENKENNLLILIIKVQILFAHTIIMSTARAYSLFPSNLANFVLMGTN